MIPQTTRLRIPPAKALDLLNVVDLEHGGVGRLALEEQRDQHRPLRVRVDAAAGVALGEGGDEEGRALGGLEGGRGAQVDAIFGVELCGE